jgi:Na+/H+-dicarboxylate symporter
MTDPITKPDAEAKALAAAITKTAPPPLPAGSILGVTAEQAKNAAPVRVVDPAKVAAAIASIKAAQDSINTAGDVTGDLALATTGCTTR